MSLHGHNRGIRQRRSQKFVLGGIKFTWLDFGATYTTTLPPVATPLACAQEKDHERGGWTTCQKTARLCISQYQRPTDLLKTRHSGEVGSGTVKLELTRQRRRGINSSRPKSLNKTRDIS